MELGEAACTPPNMHGHNRTHRGRDTHGAPLQRCLELTLRHHDAQVGTLGWRPAARSDDCQQRDRRAHILLGPYVGTATRCGRKGTAALGNTLQRAHSHQPLVGRLYNIIDTNVEHRLQTSNQGLHLIYRAQGEVIICATPPLNDDLWD